MKKKKLVIHIVIISLILIASYSSATGLELDYLDKKTSSNFIDEELTNNFEKPLDIQFIYNITENLSNIVFDEYDEDNGEIAKGRAFGTKGEHKAAEIITENMSNVGLLTTLEKLEKRPDKPDDFITNKLEVLEYNFKINNEDIESYIAPTWKGPRDKPTELDNNFSYNDLKVIPIPKYPLLYNRKLAKETDDFLFIDNDLWNDPNAKLPYLDPLKPLLDPLKFYMLFHIVTLYKIQLQTTLWYKFYPSCKGLILYDFNEDCHDMIAFTESCKISLPVIFISNRDGRKILDNIQDSRVDYHLKQRFNTSVESYNVVGEITGENPDKTIILSCLYDSWWCQGTADSAIGMGIIMAIAKYFIENNITPKYTMKFIGFSGEEYMMNGAIYYESTHKDENILYVIDLNQLGFTQEEPRLTFDIVANKLPFLNKVWDVVKRSNYVQRTNNVTDIKAIYWPSGTLPSDALPFAVNRPKCKALLFLKDGGWILHHRDGMNHTEGDAFKYFNWTDVSVTSEIILNVTKSIVLEENVVSNNLINNSDFLVDKISKNIFSTLENWFKKRL